MSVLIEPNQHRSFGPTCVKRRLASLHESWTSSMKRALRGRMAGPDKSGLNTISISRNGRTGNRRALERAEAQRSTGLWFGRLAGRRLRGARPFHAMLSHRTPSLNVSDVANTCLDASSKCLPGDANDTPAKECFLYSFRCADGTTPSVVRPRA